MPAENGITAAKEIRQYDNVVKIIFLTSSAEFAVESYVVVPISTSSSPSGRTAFSV